jgi:thiamine biosynthesis lipoprotein ApbE
MKEFTFEERLMGSDLAVAIVASDENAARENYQRALSLGREYEERFSRFLPHSELSRLNTKKSLVVSDEFMRVFGIARRHGRAVHQAVHLRG